MNALELTRPLALLALALLPLIWWLQRTPARTVSTDRLALWDRALHRVPRARQPWLPLRTLLALVAFTLLSVAAAGLRVREQQGYRRLWCVIDQSASMQAREGDATGRTRAAIALDGAPIRVEMFYNQRDSQWGNERGLERFVHLVDYAADKREVGTPYVQDFTAVHGIRIRLRLEREPRSVALVPDGRAVAYEFEDNWLSFEAEPLLIHAVSLLSGYKSNKVNWLQRCSDLFCRWIVVSRCKISTFSKSEMVKICRISARLRSICSCFFTMATST